MKQRGDQFAEAIRQSAAEYLSHESNRTSLITVTRVEVADRLKRATIFFTVLPQTEEEPALSFARRKRGVFRRILERKLRLHPLPFIDFAIDEGEKSRQRLDELRDAERNKA